MCGFVGYVLAQGAQPFVDASEVLARAADTLRARGPDDGGTWLADDGGAGLGFRRLAILDLGPHGHQPMTSADGRHVIVFNGEIYNFKSLRAQLDAERPQPWRGHSDTEVLLELISRYGVAEALARVDGMFAFALWNLAEKTLTLGRDRFGEKPLYYGWSDGAFVFGSDLRALKALPGFRSDLSQDALAVYFRYRYIPAPRTIYTAYAKLPPASLLTVRAGKIEVAPYWDRLKEARTAFANPFTGSLDQAVEETGRLFQAAVANRLEADVPLGVFLSGGVDSSLAAAYAQIVSPQPVNTFTIGFENDHFNEAPHAKAVARHLGTNHTEIMVTEHDALAVVDGLADMFSEPFADPSQLPTALLCAKAKDHVTVALAGDGGDELFCGYGRYESQVERWASGTRLSPAAAYALAVAVPVAVLDALDGLRGKPGKLGRVWRTRLMERASRTPEAFFMAASGFWRDGVPVQGVDGLEQALFQPHALDLPGAAHVQRFQMLDAGLYLPDDVLVKTDRASMAASLEVRTPFLNLDLARFAWSLPVDLYDPQKFGLKVVLKKLLARHVPTELFERPKMGFDVPLRHWLRGALKAWGDELIHTPCPLAQDRLDMTRIQKRWVEHQKGRNGEGDLWPALMMLSWMRRHT